MHLKPLKDDMKNIVSGSGFDVDMELQNNIEIEGYTKSVKNNEKSKRFVKWEILIGLVGRVFASGPGGPGFNPRSRHT